MFAGFQLNLDENKFPDFIDFSIYRDEGVRHLDAQKASVKTELERFVINEDGNQTINGTLLGDNWFPQVKADIFLSHSHKDLELVQGVAGWLYKEFGLRCFIDSNVWGYSDDLLEILNSKYSNKRLDGSGVFLYNHEKCIAASKHVDVMLNIALQRMIDQTEAIFLISTDNAVQRYGQTSNNKTYSPWIYSETVCSDIVRKKPLSLYRPEFWTFEKSINEQFELEHRADAQEGLNIAYEISTEHLIPLTHLDLLRWHIQQVHRPCSYPLDMLYINKLGKPAQKLNNLYCNPIYEQLLYCT